MALETEGKSLSDDVISQGVETFINDERLGFYLVCIEEEQVIACLGITFEWSDWRDGLFWWIQSVYVDESHRGKGVFSAMYAEVKTLARQGGNVCGLRLYVERDNQRAERTYRRLGMIETDYKLMEEEF